MPLDKVFGYRVLCDEKRAESDKTTGLVTTRPCQASRVIVCDSQSIFKDFSDEDIIKQAGDSGFLYNPEKKTFMCRECREKENKKAMPAHIPTNLN